MDVTPPSPGSQSDRASTRLAPLVLVGIIAFLLAWLLPLAFETRESAPGSRQNAEDAWLKIGDGMKRGVSGIEMFSLPDAEPAFLIVHDNKLYTDGPTPEPRLALIRRRGGAEAVYQPIAWPVSQQPEDLEALAVIPGPPRYFAALTSKGQLYALALNADATSMQIVHQTSVPNPENKLEFEAFEIGSLGGQTFALWCDRGDASQPGRLFWGTLDLQTMVIDPANVQAANISVPWPTTAARPVSDAKVDGLGTLYISSSTDPGDQGPFASAVYVAGNFRMVDSRIVFEPNPQLTRLHVTGSHKIEALALWPGAGGGLVLGSDDEMAGGAIWIAQ